jgi:hypothetical protein
MRTSADSAFYQILDCRELARDSRAFLRCVRVVLAIQAFIHCLEVRLGNLLPEVDGEGAEDALPTDLRSV